MKKSYLLLFTFFLFILSAHSTTFYVKYDASGSNNGTSWSNAYTSLQSALNAANSGDVIWVAKGTYLPSTEVGGTGNRYKTFQLKNGVKVYGGFAGNESSDYNLDNRDFVINNTILSGDLGSDTYVYHVFRHINLSLTSTATLDGFTITGGKADGSGDDTKGGGMINQGSSSANGSNPTIKNCVFNNNSATQGGAIYNSRYCSPAISYSTFSSNTASSQGGAVFNVRNTATFNYCTFSNNNITASNTETNGGGAIYSTTSTATEGTTISNCIFSQNKVGTTDPNPRGGAIYGYINPGYLRISNSSFEHNEGNYGGAIYVNSSSATNRTNSDISITKSIFEKNKATYGGAVFNDNHNTITSSCIFRANEAKEQSAGYYSRYSATGKIINSVICGNKSIKHGGGIYFNNDNNTIINCTVSGNTSGERGGGISIISTSNINIYNSIIWGNASAEGNQLNVQEGTASMDYCIYESGASNIQTINGGTLNISNSKTSNPIFINPISANNAPTLLGNYQISNISSPAADAGLNSHLPSGYNTLDVNGNPRIIDGDKNNNAIVDIGAYEIQLPFVWSGNEDADFNNSENWEDGESPIESSNIIIPYLSGMNINYPNIETNKTIKTLTVNSGAKLTNNSVFTINDTITLLSNDTKTGQILNNGTIINNGVVRIRKSFNSSYGWYFISFPFNVPATNVKVSSTQEQATWGNYGDSGKDFYVQEYDAASRATGNFSATSSPNWRNVPEKEFIANKGYILVVLNNITLDFISASKEQGIFNTSADVNITKYPSSTSSNQDWNLVGIPFASAFDLLNATQVHAPFYYYNNGTYATIMPDESYEVLPFSAFFLQAHGAPETVTFSSVGRLLKFASSVNFDEITLTVKNTTYSDKTRIRLQDGASLDYELGKDAMKFFSQKAGVPQIRSKAGKLDLSVNAVPRTTKEILVEVTIAESGRYNISIEDITKIKQLQKVVLLDTETSAETELLTEQSYTFEGTQGIKKHFKVILIENPDKIISEENNEIIIKTVGNSVNITGLINQGTVKVYDATNKLTQHFSTVENNFMFEMRKSGIFVIEVKTPTQLSRVKVFIF